MSRLYRCRASLSEIAAAFQATAPAGLTWDATSWPGRPALVVRQLGAARRIERMPWGIAPSGDDRMVAAIRDMSGPLGLGDPRDPPERCLIVVESFALPDGPRGARMRSWAGIEERPLFAWAGFCRDIRIGIPGFVELLTAPNTLIAPIAGAMPLILEHSEHAQWLTGTRGDALRLRRPYPPDGMYLERTDEPWSGASGAGRSEGRMIDP